MSERTILEKQQPTTHTDRERLFEDYRAVRSASESLAAPITPEDAQIQSMPDASPTKWHLGHTSWFFETFLVCAGTDAAVFREEFKVLFNSYYNSIGEQHPRPQRGMLSRPALEEVLDYRHHVDAGVRDYLFRADPKKLNHAAGIVRVGLHHEQQHQELMMTDLLHALWTNPLRPAYREEEPPISSPAAPVRFHQYPEGIYRIGHNGQSFGWDNEYPRHRTFLHDFELASRLTTAAEYMNFMADGGYQRPTLWLSDGWAKVQEEGWTAPMYWERRQGTWWHMTLHGMRPVDPNTPVSHISYYEADAFARWAEARLPTEEEWEIAAEPLPIEGNLQETAGLTPLGVRDATLGSSYPGQMYGDVWEWTGSAYLAYPGYRITDGALGEYNGKFMCNQMVLRGGSCLTPLRHIRPSYRNFFPPHARWQFSGVRLARDT